MIANGGALFPLGLQVRRGLNNFGSTLDEVTEMGESLFPATQDADAERLSKAERAEQARRRNDDGGVP